MIAQPTSLNSPLCIKGASGSPYLALFLADPGKSHTVYRTVFVHSGIIVVCSVVCNETSLVYCRRAQASMSRFLPRKARLPEMAWYVGSKVCTDMVLCGCVLASFPGPRPASRRLQYGFTVLQATGSWARAWERG